MSDINTNAEACINSLDTYIDVLKEESAKLSNMIVKLNDKIKEVEAEKEQLIKQNESKFEIAQDEKYYFVSFNSRGHNLAVTSDIYKNVGCDKARVAQNNCFKTEKRAKEVLNKIELLLKLERLHDIYCLDYTPDWNDGRDIKYLVYYDSDRNKWHIYTCQFMQIPYCVYFPTEEMAQKVCDILNKEE